MLEELGWSDREPVKARASSTAVVFVTCPRTLPLPWLLLTAFFERGKGCPSQTFTAGHVYAEKPGATRKNRASCNSRIKGRLATKHWQKGRVAHCRCACPHEQLVAPPDSPGAAQPLSSGVWGRPPPLRDQGFTRQAPVERFANKKSSSEKEQPPSQEQEHHERAKQHASLRANLASSLLK